VYVPPLGQRVLAMAQRLRVDGDDPGPGGRPEERGVLDLQALDPRVWLLRSTLGAGPKVSSTEAQRARRASLLENTTPLARPHDGRLCQNGEVVQFSSRWRASPGRRLHPGAVRCGGWKVTMDSSLPGVHPVAQLLLERAAKGSHPGARDDNYQVALAIEGGGMRGAITAGMVAAIEQLGLVDSFDAVYGSSAGAINGAYLLAGQATYATTVYYQDIDNMAFVNPFRPLIGRPIVSLEYLIDEVMVNRKPIDWRTILDSKIPLRVVATSLRRGEAVTLQGFRTREGLFEALRASARIPLLAGGPVSVNGDPCMDATICQTIPYEAALRDGFTHVLVLRANAKGVGLGEPRLFGYLAAHRLGRSHSRLRAAMLSRHGDYAKAVDFMDSANVEWGRPPHVMSVYPSEEAARVHPLDTNHERLLGGTAAGLRSCVLSLTGEHVGSVQLLRAF